MHIGMLSIFRRMMNNRARTLLTAGGIAVGAASVIAVSSVGEIGKAIIDNRMTDMGMESVVVTCDSYPLWEDELETVKSLDIVDNAMPMMNCYTQTRIRENSEETMVWGVNEDADEIIRLDVLSGRMFNAGDIQGGEKVCLVDEQLALDSYERTNIVGKSAVISFGGIEEEYRIIGVVDNGVNILQNMFGDLVPSFVYVPYTSMNEELAEFSFDEITVHLNDEKYADIAGNVISRALSCKADELVSVSAENLFRQKNSLGAIADTVSSVLVVIGGISLVVSGLSVMTVMLTTVRERRREIGIKKSLGATKADIMAEFISESVMLSLLGTTSGVLVGLVLFAIMKSLTDINVAPDIGMIIFTVAFSVFSGVFFGAYPAYKASCMKPVDALRNE